MYIRPYQASDWPSLCEIHDAARRDELRLSAMEQAFLPLEQAAHTEDLFSLQLFVAQIERRVEGFVAYSASELAWLYVSPASYRRGVGRALVRHVLAQSEPGLTIEVLVGNEPALQLYLSEGFKILRRVDGRLAGNEAHAASGYVLEFNAQAMYSSPGGQSG